MRILARRIVLLSMVMVLVAVGRSWAQDTLVANVPFAFTVDGTAHPAGRYEFFVMSDGKAVELEATGRRGEFVGTTPLTDPNGGVLDSKLVFETIGGTRYLSEVWAPGRGGFLLYPVAGMHPRQTIRLQSMHDTH